MREAPFSYQVHLLNAEALETQAKWPEAAAEYRKILDINPTLPGVHARLGRVLLSGAQPSPDAVAQAKQNFQQELEIDPNNAASEYVLGELAKEDNDFSTAITHYTRATKIDHSFAEAYLGLGSALVSTDQFADAIPRSKPTKKWPPTAPQATINWRSPTTAPAAKKTPIAKPLSNATPPRPSNSSNAASPKASSIKSPRSEIRAPHF